MPPDHDILGFLRQGASVAGTRFVLIAASFVSSVVVTRALPVEERGLFGLLMAVGALGVQFGNFGLPVANTYLVARNRRLLAALVSNTGCIFILIIAFLAAAGTLAVRFVPAWRSLWGAATAMVWLVAVTGLAQMLAQNLLTGRFLFNISNWVDVIARLGAIAAMACLWFAGLVTAEWFAVAASAFALVGTAWGLRAGKIVLLLNAWDARLGREQLRVGVRAYVACLASFVVSRLPLYAVGSRGSLDEAAFFTQALVIADTMLVVPTALGVVLFPNLAATANAAERVHSTLRLIAVTAVLMILAVGAAWWLGPWALPWVYGPAYAATMPLLVLMLPGVAALGLCSVTQNALSANGYPWAAVASPLAGVGVVIVTLQFTDGVTGCARAYTAGGLAMLATSALAWWSHRHIVLVVSATDSDLTTRSET